MRIKVPLRKGVSGSRNSHRSTTAHFGIIDRESEFGILHVQHHVQVLALHHAQARSDVGAIWTLGDGFEARVRNLSSSRCRCCLRIPWFTLGEELRRGFVAFRLHAVCALVLLVGVLDHALLGAFRFVMAALLIPEVANRRPQWSCHPRGSVCQWSRC